MYHRIYVYIRSTVINSAPCLVYPHRLQGRLAALLVLYAYVIICRSTNVYVHGGVVTVSVHNLYRI